jgi:5-methylcytosine-specific restriction protein A
MSDWQIAIGDRTTRSDIARDYGGSRFSGINPSRETPNVMIYSDHGEADAHGYSFDGWVESDSVFHYTGHGPEGDQQMKSGNRAIRDHRLDGRSLRVFVADGVVAGTKETKQQLYLGEFAVDADEPYCVAEGPDRNGDLRAVFVFRLQPVGPALIRPEDRSSAPPRASVDEIEEVAVDTTIDEVEMESQHHPEFDRAGVAPMTARRREAEMVKRYQSALESHGHRVTSFLIKPKGQFTSMRVDLFDHHTGELCEAKGHATRDSVRLAIGQLLDYARHVHHQYLAVLLPTRPNDDLLDLLSDLHMTCIYEDDDEFRRIAPSTDPHVAH